MKNLYIKMIDRWEASRRKEAEWLRKHMFLGILAITGLIIWKMIQNKLTAEGLSKHIHIVRQMPEDMIEAKKIKALEKSVDDTIRPWSEEDEEEYNL